MLLKTILLWAVIDLSYSFSLSNGFDCHSCLRQLGDHQAHLIQCITINSVPVTMCTNCVDKYTEVLKLYDDLAVNCSSLYFDNDRINVVTSTTSALKGLWTRAFCDDCSNNNNSFIFNAKSTKFWNCLNNTKSDPCEICKTQYLDLNSFFTNLDQQNNGEVCYDLQDSMNRTRNIWSKVLKCCRREQNMNLFTIALSIVSCLPVLFYGSAYFITKHQERNHGVLNDDGPIYNSELPTSSRQYNSNEINNSIRPSHADVNNTVTTKSESKQVSKNGLHFQEDLGSSDDDMQTNAKFDLKQK